MNCWGELLGGPGARKGDAIPSDDTLGRRWLGPGVVTSHSATTELGHIGHARHVIFVQLRHVPGAGRCRFPVGQHQSRNGKPVVRRGRKARGLERSRRPSYRRRFVVRKIWLQALVAAAVALALFPGTASAAPRVEVTTGGGSLGSTPQLKRRWRGFRCGSLHLPDRAEGNSGRAAATAARCRAPTGAESTHPQDLRLGRVRGRGSPPWSSTGRGWHPSASPSSFREASSADPKRFTPPRDS
jgi:hypothetical protein